jgi:hypothetical protein
VIRKHGVGLPFALVIAAGAAHAQVPDGWIVWCSFQGVAGQTGVFFSHPRDPNEPFVAVTGLSPDLAYSPGAKQGASCVVRRPADGALLVGERAPAGRSVDLHVLTLRGNDVVRAALFSVGTSATAGEIPQCAILPDGRVLLAGTDLTRGPLAVQATLSYNKQGVGILDVDSGCIDVVPIANFTQLGGVINAITASMDGSTAYIGNYLSTTAGDLWSVPLPAGGQATLVAQFGAGVSSLAVDLDGSLLVTTLNGPPNLHRVDVGSGAVQVVTTTSGPLNAIAIERATGNWIVASANSGIPPRSLFWFEPNGTEHLLASPNMATIAGVELNPNPEAFGAATPGAASAHQWRFGPNPNGLPLVGNPGFALTERTTGTVTPGVVAFALRRLASPVQVLGCEVHIDLSRFVAGASLALVPDNTIPLPIPNVTTLRGAELFVQTFHLEPSGSSLSASPGLHLTIL